MKTSFSREEEELQRLWPVAGGGGQRRGGADGADGRDGLPWPRSGPHGADPARGGPDLARGAGGDCHGGEGRARPRLAARGRGRGGRDGRLLLLKKAARRRTGRRRGRGGPRPGRGRRKGEKKGTAALLLLRLDLRVWGWRMPPPGAR